MPRRKRETTPPPVPTIWRVSDNLWAKIEAILAEYDPPKRVGRKRIDQRRALDGILYRCAAVCSGTSSGTIVRSIAPSSVG